MEERFVLSYPILCLLCHIHQRKQIKIKIMRLWVFFNVECQVHIVFKNASTKRGHFISQIHSTNVKCSVKPCIFLTKNISNASRQKLAEWIMKYSNVRESPIVSDALLIADGESGVKRIVPKLLLEYSMRQLHNELIASPDDGGLLGSIHADKNDVIISDTMLRSLVSPKLLPMIDHYKMMCGCDICNTSKYFQESLNVWRRKKLKIMKDKADNSRGSKKDELTQA